MEAIKGSDVNVPDAVFAWLLDGRGGVKPLEDNDVIDSQHPCWLHLNYTHPDSARWLASTPLLPNNVRDALAGESSRPRVSRLGEGTLITLRCINGSFGEAIIFARIGDATNSSSNQQRRGLWEI